MTDAEMAEILRGAEALIAGIADETADARLAAIAAAVGACAAAAEEAWEDGRAKGPRNAA